MNFKEDIKKRRLYFDGAMGTMIHERVNQIPKVPESLNLIAPDAIRQIQKDYVDAGANIILTNTFGANEYKMVDSDYSVEDVISAGVEIARSVCPDYVCLDIGPLGTLIGNLGDLSFEEAISVYKRSVRAGVRAGVDLVILGTMTDIYEVKAAMIAVKEVCDLPIIPSLTFEANGRTLTGTDPLTAVTVLEALGADMIGINCSMGPDQMLPIVDELLKYAHVPIAVQPNAGLPRMENGKTVFDVSPDIFVNHMIRMADKGVNLLGGCCGTTPEYIHRLVKKTKDIPISLPFGEEVTRITTSTRTVTLGQDIRVIGERINPSASKKLKTDLKQGSLKTVYDLAMQQVSEGVHVLDVNLGLPEIDEAAMMTKAVQELNEMTDTPLQIDSSDPKALEAALRVYNGKPLVNSVNGTESSLKAILPLIKKYGACVLGLTLDEEGIPDSSEKRIQIADRIMASATEMGIPKRDILFDCLTLTASSQQKNVRETLNAISVLKQKYHSPMVLGVSNISFGLPRRSLINRTFLTMALQEGLDTPIIDSGDAGMMDAISAYRVLSGNDQDGMDYIEKNLNKTDPSSLESEKNNVFNSDKSLMEIVVGGFRDKAVDATKNLLLKVSPMDIVNQHLIPGLDCVGRDFETGKVFLPNLMHSAETAQKAFEVIKASLAQTEMVSKGSILLASVKGDVHDIGKNILKVILENYGYSIIDLGKDADPQMIIDTVKKHDIRLVGLSALMTTTVKNMEETITLLKSQCPKTKIMVGGAVLNQEYAAAIGADAYGKDAMAGVAIANNFFS